MEKKYYKKISWCNEHMSGGLTSPQNINHAISTISFVLNLIESIHFSRLMDLK